MKEEWLLNGAVVPVDVETTSVLVAEIHRLIGVVGGMALAQPEQEPVAWGVFEGSLHDMFFTQSEAQEMAKLKGTHAEVRPLYAAPQRTWLGLTEEEVMECLDQVYGVNVRFGAFAEVIEAKLKEKNT